MSDTKTYAIEYGVREIVDPVSDDGYVGCRGEFNLADDVQVTEDEMIDIGLGYQYIPTLFFESLE